MKKFNQFCKACSEFEFDDTLNTERESDDKNAFVEKKYQKRKTSYSSY